MGWKHRFWWRLSVAFLLLGRVVARWKLIALLALFVSPEGPYLRFAYSGASCTYIGAHGFRLESLSPDCPVLAWLKQEEFQL